jgi:hypothetical protein
LKIIKFSHITKTAGTTIEHIASLNNINWGWLDADFWRNLVVFSKYKYETDSPWHFPISFCENKELLKEVFLKYNFFTVVRNPYERCISEYYCKYGGPEIKSTKKKDFNSYIKKNLIDIKNFKFTSGHFIPQFFYAYDKNNKKIIEHVLKYENVSNEFNELMKKYNYKLNFVYEENLSKKFKQYDFEKETIKLIQEVYYKDFIFFNYDINPLYKL